MRSHRADVPAATLAWRAVFMLALALGWLSSSALNADEAEGPPVTQVTFRELPKGAGKIATYRGTADSKGVGFYIEGPSINTPLGVLLISGDTASPMKLAMKNDLSLAWDKQYSADASGLIKAQLRTEGPAFALVTSAGEMKPYYLAIWLGPEVKVHKVLGPPFVSSAEYERRHGGRLKRYGLWLGLGTVIVVAGVMIILRQRRRQSSWA